MSKAAVRTPLAKVRDSATRLSGTPRDYDELLAMAEGRHFVLLGEASHGTHEFYEMRADITRRLIEEQGFDAVLVEGDWPDMYRVNRYVRGDDRDNTAEESLGNFTRFPRWMWRNVVVENFVDWLTDRNVAVPERERAGIYGMDVYSLQASAAAVIEYLDRTDPQAAARARERYGCLDHAGDPQRYGYAVAMGVSEGCETEAVAQLAELLAARGDAIVNDGLAAQDEQFFAEMNARVVQNAEAYYRGMFSSRVNTWNLRDSHMADTLFSLQRHIGEQRGRRAKIAVWAHNSHLGDARATQAARRGEHNLGQLVRERAGDDCLLVGFTTYTGHVTAARDWDSPAEHRWVRPALEDSVERLFERTKLDRFFLPLDGERQDELRERTLERAIGVIYRPETERQSHYFQVSLPEQFDAVFHLDETRALQPLDINDRWSRREPPETWPFGT